MILPWRHAIWAHVPAYARPCCSRATRPASRITFITTQRASRHSLPRLSSKSSRSRATGCSIHSWEAVRASSRGSLSGARWSAWTLTPWPTSSPLPAQLPCHRPMKLNSWVGLPTSQEGRRPPTRRGEERRASPTFRTGSKRSWPRPSVRLLSCPFPGSGPSPDARCSAWASGLSKLGSPLSSDDAALLTNSPASFGRCSREWNDSWSNVEPLESQRIRSQVTGAFFTAARLASETKAPWHRFKTGSSLS